MVRVYLIGRVMIETDAGVFGPSALPGRQGRLALAYLASAPRRVDRDALATALWSDELPDAWDGALSAIVSKLRKTLTRAGLDGSAAIDSGDGAYELRLPAGTWIDMREAVNSVDRAEGALARGDAAGAWSNATVASAILRRPFLPGETGHWVDQKRRQLYEFQVRAFDTLAGAWLVQGNARAAVHAARSAVDLAPFRESAYARLMEAHLAAGDRAEALRVYEELRSLLADSMGISPAGRTEELYLQALGE